MSNRTVGAAVFQHSEAEYATERTARDVRRANLGVLLDLIYTARELAEALRVNECYVSHLRHGRRPITHYTARRIEEALRLHRGWLDGGYVP